MAQGVLGGAYGDEDSPSPRRAPDDTDLHALQEARGVQLPADVFPRRNPGDPPPGTREEGREIGFSGAAILSRHDFD